MVKIIAAKDCGNAPKAKFILKFLTAVAKMEVDTAVDMLEEHAEMEIIGHKCYIGKKQITNLILKDSKHSKVTQVEIYHILSHGKHCTANGIMHLKDGEKVAFNNIYSFSGHGTKAKLKFIKIYALEF